MLKNETARNGLKHDSLQNEVRYFQAGDYVIDDSTKDLCPKPIKS